MEHRNIKSSMVLGSMNSTYTEFKEHRDLGYQQPDITQHVVQPYSYFIPDKQVKPIKKTHAYLQQIESKYKEDSQQRQFPNQSNKLYQQQQQRQIIKQKQQGKDFDVQEDINEDEQEQNDLRIIKQKLPVEEDDEYVERVTVKNTKDDVPQVFKRLKAKEQQLSDAKQSSPIKGSNNDQNEIVFLNRTPSPETKYKLLQQGYSERQSRNSFKNEESKEKWNIGEIEKSKHSNPFLYDDESKSKKPSFLFDDNEKSISGQQKEEAQFYEATFRNQPKNNNNQIQNKIYEQFIQKKANNQQDILEEQKQNQNKTLITQQPQYLIDNQNRINDVNFNQQKQASDIFQPEPPTQKFLQIQHNQVEESNQMNQLVIKQKIQSRNASFQQRETNQLKDLFNSTPQKNTDLLQDLNFNARPKFLIVTKEIVNQKIISLTNAFENEYQSSKLNEGKATSKEYKALAYQAIQLARNIIQSEEIDPLARFYKESEVRMVESINELSAAEAQLVTQFHKKLQELTIDKIQQIKKDLLPNVQIDKNKQEFIKRASEFIKKFPRKNPLHTPLVLGLYEEAIKLKVKDEDWEKFLYAQMQNQEQENLIEQY